MKIKKKKKKKKKANANADSTRDPPHPKRTAGGAELSLALLPRAMDAHADVVLLALDFGEFVFKGALLLVGKAGVLEVGEEGVGGGGVGEVGEEAVDVCAADAEVFELGFEEGEVVGCVEGGGGLGQGFGGGERGGGRGGRGREGAGRVDCGGAWGGGCGAWGEVACWWGWFEVAVCGWDWTAPVEDRWSGFCDDALLWEGR